MVVGLLAVVLFGMGLFRSERVDGESKPPRVQVSREQLRAGLQGLQAPVRDHASVEWVNNGRIFEVLEEEIRQAEHSVHILVFIWRKSDPSDRLVEAIRSRPGIECRVVLDPIASPNFNEEVRPQLESAGCEVREYKPVKQSVREGAEALERTHRKIVVVDGKVGVTGGFGIWKSWEGEGLTEETWRDTNVRVRGPVVAELQRAFGETWSRTGGSPLPAGAFPKLAPAGRAQAAFVASDASEGNADPEGKTSAEELAELLVASAERRLWIANSYFVPTDRILAVLEAKAHAGVDVRVLAPGPVHDWRSVRDAQRVSYRRLIKAGVRIYEYQPSMMHAKTFLVDEDLVSVGSMNLDPLSLRQLEEGQLVVLGDAALAKALEQDLLQDFQRSQEQESAFPGPLELSARAMFWLLGDL